MNDNDPTEIAIEELRGENEALRRALLELVETLGADHREAVKQRIASCGTEGDIGNPRRGAYRDTLDWFVRHIGR
jgi:hypothetical protein